MRTTVDLDPTLLAQLKQRAASSGRTMGSLVEDAVREMLARGTGSRKGGQRITLPTFKGRGLRPGVDLWDSAALLDLMEERRR